VNSGTLAIKEAHQWLHLTGKIRGPTYLCSIVILGPGGTIIKS